MKCKYTKKSARGENYIRCRLDGSIRKIYKGCPCVKFEITWFQRLLKKARRR